METAPYVRQAQFYETDQMGIIHHANYIHWMEEARVDFMEQVGFGYDKTTQAGVDFAVLGISCDYKSMVRFYDIVEIHVSFSLLTNTRMNVAYKIVDQKTGELRATGESKHCIFDQKKQRPVSLKKNLPHLFELFSQYYQPKEGK